MTKREMYVAIVNGEMTEEMQTLAAELLEGLDASNAKRKEKAAEKRAEKLEAEKVIEDAILAVLRDEPMTASDIRDAVEGLETPQKATVVAKRLVEAGRVKVDKVKGKNGKVNGYTLA